LCRKPPIRFVNRSQQLAERGNLLDRPNALECWTEQVEVLLRKQSDGYDALIHDGRSVT
jgi:hypothetical protein